MESSSLSKLPYWGIAMIAVICYLILAFPALPGLIVKQAPASDQWKLMWK